jgi:GNAT superfamily N-acetyltransferase
VRAAAHARAGDLERIAVKAYLAFYGPRARRVGSARVLRADEAPDSPMLNRIAGLGVDIPATQEDLDRALAAAAGTTCYIAFSPHARPRELPRWLSGRGLERSWGWRQFVRGVEDPPPAVRNGIELVEVSGRQEAETFARIVAGAYGLPAETLPWLASVVRSGWRSWLAVEDHEAVGAAALYADDGLGYLGFAGTLPEHRGRGAQSALLAGRIRHARKLGCRLVVTETGDRRPDRPSSSYRNIIRAGFEERHVVENWIRRSRRRASGGGGTARAHRRGSPPRGSGRRAAPKRP